MKEIRSGFLYPSETRSTQLIARIRLLFCTFKHMHNIYFHCSVKKCSFFQCIYMSATLVFTDMCKWDRDRPNTAITDHSDELILWEQKKKTSSCPWGGSITVGRHLFSVRQNLAEWVSKTYLAPLRQSLIASSNNNKNNRNQRHTKLQSSMTLTPPGGVWRAF